MPRKTKKQLQKETLDLLVTELFKAVGVYISNNYIFDQDTNLPWKFKNKLVKYNTDIVHNDETLFNPIFSKHMVKDLFNMLLHKAIEYDGLYVKYICPIFDHNGKYIQIFTSDCVLTSRAYQNEILMYYDICFEISRINSVELIDALRYADTFIHLYYPKSNNKRKRGLFDDIYR